MTRTPRTPLVVLASGVATLVVGLVAGVSGEVGSQGVPAGAPGPAATHAGRSGTTTGSGDPADATVAVKDPAPPSHTMMTVTQPSLGR